MADRIFRGLRTKKTTSETDMYDRVLRTCLWLALFLVPFFLFPSSTDPLEFSKAMLFDILILVAGLTWFLRAILRRDQTWHRTPYDLPIAVFLLSSIIATVFSWYPYRSLVGTSGYVADSLVATLFFALFFFLLSHSVKREQLPNYVAAMLSSGGIIVLFNFLQVFNLTILPWNFAKVVSFNGASGSSLIFTLYIAVIGLFAFYKLLANHRPLVKIFLTFLSVLSFFLLFVYDQALAWYAVILGLVLLIVFLNAATKEQKAMWLVVPTLLIGLSLLGLLGNTQQLLRANLPGDVILPAHMGWSTTWASLKHRPFFGSGQETYDATFATYRPQSFNDTALWNVRFQKSSNTWFQLLSTVGVIGALAFFAVVALFLWNALRDVLKTKFDEPYWWHRLAVFVAGLIVSLSFFFTPANFLLLFLFWMLLGLSVVVRREQKSDAARAEKEARVGFGASLGFSGMVILAIVLLYFAGRFWWADHQVAVAQAEVQKTQSLESVRGHLANATSLNPYEQSTYFSLAQNLLVQAQVAAQTDKPNIDQIRTFLTASAASAQTGASKYTHYAGSYEALGTVLRNIDSLSGTSGDGTLAALNKAIELEPKNPQLYLSLGQFYIAAAQLQAAQDTKDKADAQLSDKTKTSLTSAKTALKQATDLKNNYVDALLDVALITRLEGNGKEAVAQLESLVAQNPSDVNVLFNLAENYTIDGRDDDALAVYLRVVALQPGHSDAHFRLASLYEKKGEKDKAIAELQIVLKYNPGNTDVQKKLDELKGTAK